MIIDDPSKFHLLTIDMKEQMTKGAIASVNVMAAVTRKEAIKNLEGKFITRNTFTKRQTQFTPMPQGRYALSVIHSIVGVTEKASYMARQEEGGVHTPRQGSKLAIPTDRARGGSKRRPVAASMRVNKLKRRRVRAPERSDYAFWFQSEKARRVARAYIAFKKGWFIPVGNNKMQRNLFVVTKFHTQKVAKGKGYTERAKHRNVAFKLEQVYKFDKTETVTKPEPWLLPASEKVGRQVQAIFNAQMKKLGM
jgi:hypothetical protein